MSNKKFAKGGEIRRYFMEGKYSDGDSYFEEFSSEEEMRERYTQWIDEDVLGELDIASVKMFGEKDSGDVVEISRKKGSVWTDEQRKKIDALDREYYERIEELGVDKYSKQAHDIWHKEFKERFQKVFGKKMERGGALPSVTVKFKNPEYNYTTAVSPSTTEESAREYFVGKRFNVAPYPGEKFEKVIDIEFQNASQPKYLKDEEVYSYQNPNVKAPISHIQKRDYGYAYKLSLPVDGDGKVVRGGKYRKSSKWIDEESLSKRKQ